MTGAETAALTILMPLVVMAGIVLGWAMGRSGRR